MKIDLSPEERAELVRLLTAAASETSSEIHHAMDHETRENYRKHRAMLEGLLTRLGAAAPAAK
jgi:hypothetical protein